MSKRKIIVLSVLALACVWFGLYLSGYYVLRDIHASKTPLRFWTYLHYLWTMDHPAIAPAQNIIKWSGIKGLTWALIGFLMGLWLLNFKFKKPLATHGQARFANQHDLSRAGFFKATDTSIVVGKKNGRLLHFSGQQFAILAAPTRSGKGVGIVIPNLLSYQGSMVVLDIKQENFDLTSGFRQNQLGQEVFLFNPFAEDGRTHRWNPLFYVSDHPHHRVSDLSSIAAMLYPDVGADQKFWVAQARNAFLAFALYLFDTRDMERVLFKVSPKELTPCTLGNVYRLSSGNGTDLKSFLVSLSQQKYLSEACKTVFSGLLSQADETFSSIMGTFREPLNPWVNPIVDAATSDNDFLLTDVRKKKMTIYIGILPNKLAESRLIVNLLFSQLINLNTKELPQSNPNVFKYQCLLLMDEFTSIGKVDIIANAVAYMAGYNIRLLPIIQSMAQLDAVYGREHARTLITNHALQIIYAPREQQDANDYSDMLGYTTIRKEQVSRTRHDISRSEVEERRALMLPQELKAMGPDKEIFLCEGLPHPVMCDKIRYYQDKKFTQRLLPKVKISVLEFKSKKPQQTKSSVSTQDITTHTTPVTLAQNTPEEDDMNIKKLATASLVATSLAVSGCSKPLTQEERIDKEWQAQQKLAKADQYKRNPNPQKGYTITAKINNPPGKFEHVSAGARYQTEGCSYVLNSIMGVTSSPEKDLSLPVTKIGDNEYQFQFYADEMVDEDYFGNGVCRWWTTGAVISFMATGAKDETYFSADVSHKDLPPTKPITYWYWNQNYPVNKGNIELNKKFPDLSGGYSDSGNRDLTADKAVDAFSVTLTITSIEPKP